MNKTEKTMCIDDAIHTAIMVGRIAIEEGECSEEEMKEYLVTKCNEEFKAVFDASKKAFAFMALKDMLECMSTSEISGFVLEMDDHEEV